MTAEDKEAINKNLTAPAGHGGEFRKIGIKPSDLKGKTTELADLKNRLRTVESQLNAIMSRLGMVPFGGN